MKLLAKHSKRIAFFLITVMIGEIVSPLSAFALTGGPSQPEVQSFSPVSSSDMVDLFTGDFNYNIPLMDVDGYPLNLAYSGGITMDQEASWVGLGWNLNPGVINRNMRGLPDDFKGDKVKNQISMKDNATYNVEVGFKPEFFGKETKGENGPKIDTIGLPNISASAAMHLNNYRGLGFDFGIDPSFGVGCFNANLGLKFSSTDGFSADMGVGVSGKEKDDEAKTETGAGYTASWGYNSRGGLKSLNTGLNVSCKQTVRDVGYEKSGTFMGSNQTFGTQTYSPNIGAEYNSTGVSFNYGWGAEFYGLNGKMSVNGSVNLVKYKTDVVEKDAYGYLFSEEKDKNDVLLDFNREKDVPFMETSPTLPLPTGTYDMFSVSAQGMGGTFRVYRNDFPMFHDDTREQNYRKSGEKKKLIQTSLGPEYGGTQKLKIGLNVTTVFNKTYSGLWTTENGMKGKLDFADTSMDTDRSFEPGYFKMLGEFSPLKSDVLRLVGAKDLATPVSGLNYLSASLKQFNSMTEANKYIVKNNNLGSYNIHYEGRERRNKLISYLNAEEAEIAGLDKVITVLEEPSSSNEGAPAIPSALPRINSNRKAHHLSEITVTGEDGQRFVYGIPAYNNKYIEKSFAITRTNSGISPTIYQSSGQVAYDTTVGYADNTVNNRKGVDNYYSSKETPPYTHSFLLTGVLSADYVDVNGDGITDDDYGNATKFNYRLPNPNYKWRVPFQKAKANYQEGIKSSTLDDKASYLYGEKEIWHLREVEGKNHIAVFELQERNDAYGVKGDNGGLDTNMHSYMLKKITLYAKNDYRINGTSAYPIKSVHFIYDYTLCKNVENNDGDTVLQNSVNINSNKGKLTLKSLYFTYGRSNKGRLSPYVFNYSSVNPYYNLKGSDRWGTYKPNRGTYDLTGSPNNAEYPYTNQDKDSADLYASAWSLTEIVLPSGGKIQVTYEADDYAYVQDKQAMHMFSIEGFSPDYDGTKSENDMLFDRDNPKEPMKYVYFKLDKQITGVNKDEIFREQYLKDLTTIQFDLLAKVSRHTQESYEFTKVYADINPAMCGVTTDGYSGYLYMEPKAILMRKEDNDHVKKKVNPLAKAIWQFIRLQVPHQLYPMSDRNRKYDESKNRKILSTMATAFSKMSKIFSGGLEKYMFKQGYGSQVKLNKSWVRLNDPDGKKYGGGQRVKRITMNDDWASMSQDIGVENQSYGQEYIYETRDTIANRIISSGVAAYEPGIGSDENPFHVPVSTIEDIKWAPDMIHVTDEPIGESYSPAPIVGYSEIKIIPLIPSGIVKQKTGYTLNTFYTAKDFPFKISVSPIDKAKVEPFFGAFLEKKVYHTTVSQGYLVETNDMHGKPKGQLIFDSHKQLVSGSENVYSFDSEYPDRLDNKVKTVKNDGTTTDAEFGVTVDFYSDIRESKSKTLSSSFYFNTDIFNVGFVVIPILTLFPFPKREDRIFQSAVVVKHVNRIGILEKTIAYQENASIVTENLLYDYETGQVLLTSVQNEFHDNIYNFTYPAHWAYDKGMGQGYKNTGLILTGITFNSGSIYIPELSGQNLNEYLVPGDECLLFKLGSSEVKMVYAYWGKDGIINLIDADGKVISDNTYQQYTLKVIRSGRRNMQSIPIGSVTTLKNPAKTSSIQFDSILNSSAVEYSDNWKVFCNEINGISWDCQNSSELTGAFNLMLLANRLYGGTSYSIDSDTTNKYTTGYFEKLVTPHEVYDSSSLMRKFFDYTCRNNSGNQAYFNDTLTTSYYSMNHKIYFNSYVPTNKKAEFRSLFNSSSDQSWKASLGNQFSLNYIVFLQTCFCSSSGIGIKLFTNNVIPFKDITRFGNVRPFTDSLISGSINIDYQFRLTGIMSDSSEVEFIGFSSCPIFEINCTPYCVETPYSYNINPYKTGIRGNWRKVKDYAFSGDRKYQSTKVLPKKDGIYDGTQYTNFWKKESTKIPATGSYYGADKTNNKWVWTNEVTLYSPYGPELENRNALNIYSSAIYGFRHTLPLAVASNAKYKQIGYESFEDASSLIDCEKGHFSFMTNLGINSSLDKTTKHSGKTSLKVKKNVTETLEITWPDTSSDVFVKEDTNVYRKSKTDCLGTFLPDSGNYVLGAWVRDSMSAWDTAFVNPEITVEVVKGGTTTAYHLKATGLIIDGWQRIEGRFKIPSGATVVRFKLKSAEDNCSWFDDIRVHPVAGNMKSYAYDPLTLRLMADLDENNYASFYEYDLEGNLARLKRETERGIMTIKETKSSIKGAK